MKKIIDRFFNLTLMGHWWVMMVTVLLGFPSVVWPSFKENIFGEIYLVLLGLIILINLGLILYKSFFTDKYK